MPGILDPMVLNSPGFWGLLGNAVRGVGNMASAPGNVAQGQQPQTPGQWSDLDEARAQMNARGQYQWGPAMASNMLMAPGLTGGVPGLGSGIRAFHGSPYDFDKFSTANIGTGEGAQAYGRGLYFAENPSVSETYRPGPVANVSGDVPLEVQSVLDSIAGKGDAARGSLQNQIAVIRRNLSKTDSIIEQQSLTRSLMARQGALEAIDSGKVNFAPRGHMYEVNINADPSQFLDWDKPLSEQSQAVQNFFGTSGLHEPTSTGAELYRLYGRGQEDKISNSLRQAGIPGIKYLDQGSRNAQISFSPNSEGGHYFVGNSNAPYKTRADAEAAAAKLNPTSNYVVFDDKLIDIIKKYGIAGLGVMGMGSQFLPAPGREGAP